MNGKIFWDSNLWVYLFTESQNPDDIRKKQQLETLLRQMPDLVSSAQVLYEVGNALMRKYGFSEKDVREFLEKILLLTENVPMTSGISLRALHISRLAKLVEVFPQRGHR